MAKAKTTTPTSGDPWKQNFSAYIKSIVAKLGEKCSRGVVLAKIKELDGESAAKYAADKGSSFSTAINVANKFHSYVKVTAAKGVMDSTEPTLADQQNALDMLTALGKPAKEMQALVAELGKVGDLDKLAKCLDAIVKVQGHAKPSVALTV